MPQAVKMKRPISVWIAQIVLLLTILFLLYGIMDLIIYRQVTFVPFFFSIYFYPFCDRSLGIHLNDA